MEFNKNSHESESVWSAFEKLDEFEVMGESLDDLAIPDATYRQIKELYLALVSKADQLAQSQQELSHQQELLELEKRNFEAIRLQSSRESTETRLGRLVRIDQALANGESIEEVTHIEQSGNIDSSDATDFDFAPLQIETEDLHSIELTPTELKAPENPELARFKNSAENLREKSEIISAIFVELDQMVRDLGRQQELLDELKLSDSQPSATELDRVNDKLKRRFRRISRQIQLKQG